MYKFPAPAKLELVADLFEMGMVFRWWRRRIHRRFLHQCNSAPRDLSGGSYMVPGYIGLLDSLRLHSSWRWPIVCVIRGMDGFLAGVQGFFIIQQYDH